MGNFKFACGRPFGTQGTTGDFLVPTRSAGVPNIYINSSLTPVDANWSQVNVLTEHVEQAFRSTGTGTTMTIAFDLGAPRTVRAIYVDGFNVGQIVFKNGTTSAISTNTIATVNFSAGGYNPVTGRYSYLQEYTGANNVQFWGISIPSGTSVLTDAGGPSGLFEVGRICMVGETSGKLPTNQWMEMPQNFGIPYNVSAEDVGTSRQLPGGLTDSVSTSMPYALINVTGTFGRNYGDSLTGCLYKLGRVRKDERILFFENNGDPKMAYLCSKIDNINTSIEGVQISADLALREVI